MTTAYLVRHAQSDWTEGVSDRERPLTPAGIAAAGIVAERLGSLPISAIFSSPYRRSVDTVAPLAHRLGLPIEPVPDLRERQLPAVARDAFQALVERAWRSPSQSIDGGESNVAAQARGLAALRRVIQQHEGDHVVLATHGNLLALIVNGLDASYGFDFWRGLSFPDIYCLELDRDRVVSLSRLPWSG